MTQWGRVYKRIPSVKIACRRAGLSSQCFTICSYSLQIPLVGCNQNLNTGRSKKMKNIIIGTAALAVVGLLAVQMVNADTGRWYGPGERGVCVTTGGETERFTSPCATLSEEEIAQREAYREKARELREEFQKDVIDGHRITALRDELATMRSDMGLRERSETRDRRGYRGRPFCEEPGPRL